MITQRYFQRLALPSLRLLSSASFSSYRNRSENLYDHFNFPKHKEFFNEMYYQEDEAGDDNMAAEERARANRPSQEDFLDFDEPFKAENPFVPGGILSQYKKRAGLNEQDIMERDYHQQLRNIAKESDEYFDTLSKDERDIMQNTKEMVKRLRNNKEVQFTPEFRKRFMTKEYGNYDKYDKNSVSQVMERGETDQGYDMFEKNYNEMMMRLKEIDGEVEKKEEEEEFDDMMRDQRDEEHFEENYNDFDYHRNRLDDQQEHEKMVAVTNDMQAQGLNYNGRMSPMGKEQVYRNYLQGMTIKDLSLRFGILPQRVKAIIYQKHIYWNEVYPKMGETHMRLAFEREIIYAQSYPFIDYGIDLEMMAVMEQGIKVHFIPRGKNDSDPPPELAHKVEEFLKQRRPRRIDYIPEKFTGRGRKGYLLKNLVVHRGKTSAKVSTNFQKAVRCVGTPREYVLTNQVRIRMKEGGPRFASFGGSKFNRI